MAVDPTATGVGMMLVGIATIPAIYLSSLVVSGLLFDVVTAGWLLSALGFVLFIGGVNA